MQFVNVLTSLQFGGVCGKFYPEIWKFNLKKMCNVGVKVENIISYNTNALEIFTILFGTLLEFTASYESSYLSSVGNLRYTR